MRTHAHITNANNTARITTHTCFDSKEKKMKQKRSDTQTERKQLTIRLTHEDTNNSTETSTKPQQGCYTQDGVRNNGRNNSTPTTQTAEHSPHMLLLSLTKTGNVDSNSNITTMARVMTCQDGRGPSKTKPPTRVLTTRENEQQQNKRESES